MKILSSLLTLLAVTAIAGEPVSTNLPPCCRVTAPGQPVTDRSLYQLDSTWTSDVGKEIKLGVLHGRIQVVALFFAHCEFTCPITVHTLKSVQQSLPVALRERVDFLLITFDTERDTPEVLRKFREKNQLDTAHWTLLRGQGDDVRELAALLGVNYKQDARGQFAHSNVITLLNEKGEIASQLAGLNHKPEEIIRAIEELNLSQPSKPQRKANEAAP
jgi:protein SCO1/2